MRKADIFNALAGLILGALIVQFMLGYHEVSVLLAMAIGLIMWLLGYSAGWHSSGATIVYGGNLEPDPIDFDMDYTE